MAKNGARVSKGGGSESGQTAQLAKRLGYEFADPGLLVLALTHSSRNKNNNERLEFLGDSILGFVITDILFRKFPQADEGSLTRLRAALVKKQTLAGLAQELELGAHIQLGPGERRSGGQQRESILANTLEAILGAIYIDAGQAGIQQCAALIASLYAALLDGLALDDMPKDAKTRLQEYLQARRLPLPVYELIDAAGQDHAKTFTMRCSVAVLDESAIAQGGNKRMAEQQAAARLLALLDS